MKLTKGKISKLYNKQKQSVKRRKNKRSHSNKKNTFRKRRRYNLARKSLKRLHYKTGGAVYDNNAALNNQNEQLVDQSSVEPPVIEATPYVEPPIMEAASYIEPPVTIEEPVMEPPLTMEEPVKVEEPVTMEDPVMEPPLTMEDPVTVEEMPVKVEEPVIEEPVIEEPPIIVEEPVIEKPPIIVEEPPKKIEEPIPVEEIPVAEEVATEDDKLKDALDGVSKIIADEINNRVEKMVVNTRMQNGFNAVEEQAEVMADVRGGQNKRKQNSRRFKKTHKNKTRRAT